MESFHERKQENDHFGSTKSVSVDPLGEEILTLGEDDKLLNCFIAETLNLSSAHDLHVLDGKNVNSFCFLAQSYTFLVAVENQIYSFNWPNCVVQNLIHEHDEEVNLICATSAEDIIALADINNDIYFLKHSGQHQYEITQKILSSPDSKIVWIEFGPLCDTLAIFTKDLTITVIDSESYEIIFTDKSTSFCLPCFTNQSDLLFSKEGKIISRSQIHHNFAAFQNSNDTDILAIIPSTLSDHIATYDSNGTITISKYNRSIFNYSDELNLNSPQELPFVLSINHPESKLTAFFWRYDMIAAGDEDGALYLWEGIAGIPKPLAEESKPASSKANSSISDSLSSTKPKKKKPVSFIESLMAPVDPSRARSTSKINDDGDSLSDIDENEEKSSNTKLATNQRKSRASKPKQTQTKLQASKKTSKNTKLTSKKFIQDAKISDDDDDDSEMENFIESREEFEERIKQNAPEPEPEPEPEFDILPSESSSDHEIDIEPYLTPEQREKLHHHREEEEMLEKAANGLLDSEVSSEIDEENLSDLEDNEDFEFDHIFMPGNNDNFSGNRRYLCWNHYAAVLLRRDREDVSKTEIDIHVGGESRGRSMPNLNKYSLASIDENGLILASSSEVYYEHHKTWAPDRTTTLTFNSEKVSLIACGFEWFAVATDSPCIHLFTSAGLEIGIIPLPLSCLVMVGRGKYLFYAFPDGSELEFAVVSVLKNKIVVNNRSVSAIRPIKWVGFDEENKIFIQDRSNIIYFLSKDFSWQWIPILDLKDYFDTTTTGFWVVKAENDVIYGVPLRSQRSPVTYPIPKLRPLDTHLMTFDTEIRPWLLRMILPGSRKQKTDAELLKIFPSAIQNEQEFRAFHIAEQLRTNEARKFIVGYADKLDATIVADKLTGTDSKPKKKVLTIQRENSQETRKKKAPSRSHSTDKVVYVRKSKNEPKNSLQKQNEQEENEEDVNKNEEENDAQMLNDDVDGNEDENKQPVVNNLFAALKKLGSKPTSLIAARTDSADLVPKKKTKKKTIAPIVQRKRPRKSKNDDTTSFQPLFQ